MCVENKNNKENAREERLLKIVETYKKANEKEKNYLDGVISTINALAEAPRQSQT